MIEQAVLQVVAIADRLWRRNGDEFDPNCRPDGALIRAWVVAREAWLGVGLRSAGKPSVELLRVVNRHSAEEDRVVVRVQLRLRCRHPRQSLLGKRRIHLDERWTLGLSDRGWLVLRVDGDPLAEPLLRSPLIPNRSFDTDRLLEESLTELAAAQTVGPGVDLSDLVSPDEPPTLALLDLSVIDGRFLPPLISAELTRMLEAWAEAIDGTEAPLASRATDKARSTLLRPRLGERFIMRDPVLKSWEACRLHLARHPPAVEVKVEIEAVRYLEATDGGRCVGNVTDPRHLSMVWLLELTGSPMTPWRLAATSSPALALPDTA
jgi:hypothetical protein